MLATTVQLSQGDRSTRLVDHDHFGNVCPLRPLHRGMPRGDQATCSDRTNDKAEMRFLPKHL